MASCCRERRKKSDPLPECQEFKVLTPDYLEHVKRLIHERAEAEKEHKKKRKAARKLRQQIEQGITEEDGEGDAQSQKIDFLPDIESVNSEDAARDEDFKDAQRVQRKGPDKRMEAGRKLSPKYAADFQRYLVGMPLIDIDPFYREKEVFIVIGKDQNINRFSATKGLFFMGPFNPVRRFALSTLVHPLFNMVVMLTIIVNCIFMAMNKEIEQVELTFTAIYTFEFLVKLLARGFALAPFTYLRDPWNWLDFLVIMLAYVMLLVEKLSSGSGSDALGNVAALRTFRVLRALKTVAVVPGLKTIVGALMEAVKKMRDVGILTLFMLSIFSLVGLQLYMGSLKHKCVLNWGKNLTDDAIEAWKQNESNWLQVDNDDHRICGDGNGAGRCPENYSCLGGIGENPNWGYTSWDSFPICMLQAFRMMTQDYWENLYFITIRANGTMHFFFFVLFILLGSFYLINLILATVAMAYNDQKERDLRESLAEENEKKASDEAHEAAHEAEMAAVMAAAQEEEQQDINLRDACKQVKQLNGSRAPSRVPSLERLLTPKPFVAHDRVSLRTDFDMDNADSDDPNRKSFKSCSSAPSSPANKRKGNSISNLVQNIHNSNFMKDGAPAHPTILSKCGIDNPLPYADDSQAVTPSSLDAHILFDYNHRAVSAEIPTGPNHHFSNRNLRASVKSHASIRSRGSVRSNRQLTVPNRALPDSSTPDEQNNIPLNFLLSNIRSNKELTLGEKLLPSNEIPSHYSSLVSLNSETKKSINMKGIHDIQQMIDIQSRARTLEEQKVSKIQLFKARFNQVCCSWTCCPCFLSVQKYLDLFISDAFMEVFIMLCILCNTIFMAAEHHGQSESFTNVLKIGNYFFTGVFSFESFLKLIAMGPVKFFKEPWNSFDFVVVSFSLFELGYELFGSGGSIGGFSVLRSFRLLRVLKLAKSWKTLNSLLLIIAKSLGALGNLTVILGIVIFIFAVMGTQLFAENYHKMADIFEEEGNEEIGLKGRIPRWNFNDFLHSLMIVFRVLCGEWLESMWNCSRAGSQYLCLPFFLLTVVIGNMVVLNLFLVLLLSSFSADALDAKKGDDDEVDKITEAKGRITRLVQYLKRHITNLLCSWRKSKAASNQQELVVLTGNGTNGIIPLNIDYTDGVENQVQVTSLEKINMDSHDNYSSSSCESLDDAEALMPKGGEELKNPDLTEVKVEYETLPKPCCCPIITKKLPPLKETPLVKKWWALRCFTYRLVEHKYFEGFIIFCIILSSMSLAVEDIYLKDRPILTMILEYMDKIFTGVFICEMLIKWLAFGWHKYFSDAWCWLDFVIVGISIASLVMESANLDNLSAFKAMRTLRALRPLRAVSRWEGMRVVVNALIQAVPAISNVLLVILIFWLIFAIMGVNFFSGKFYKCVNENGEPLHVIYRMNNGTNYVKDVLNITTKDDCISKGFAWENSKINFDDVGHAYLALLQMATFSGWVEIMADATDVTKVDENPIFENSVLYYVYFIIFIIFGSFFCLNMFIGVIIENFNAQKKKSSAGGSIEMFMTEDQKKYYNAMKKLAGKGPSKAVPRPKFRWQAAIFDFTINQKFDVSIMVFIMLNMLTMCMEYNDQPASYTEVLGYVNIVFIVVFTLEAVLKIIALRHHYFKMPWNLFDFTVVLFSILGMAFQESIEKYLNLSPTVLRVVRVFRVGRVLRLVKSAKGIRTLLFSLLVSIPALFNIGLLLFLVLFIYATFGMAFFRDVKYNEAIDQVFNFETFFRALITLFQTATAAGWDGLLKGIGNEVDCSYQSTPNKPADCGNYNVALVYMVTYLLFTFLVIINMYIAVILENFSQATEDVQQGLTQDDIDMYYELWGTYDPKATKYIPVDKLFDLVDELEEPLRVAKPNYFKLVMTDIPVCEGDRIHCSDILDMLTKLFLKQETDANLNENLPQADIKQKYGEDYKPLYGLLERQRHKWAARFIWRHYIAYREAAGRPLVRKVIEPSLSALNEFKASESHDKMSSKFKKKDKKKHSTDFKDLSEEKFHKQ